MSHLEAYVTTTCAAEMSGATESYWRQRCAAAPGFDPIPGARKFGRDWLIPLAVVSAFRRKPRGRKRAEDSAAGVEK